MKNLKEKTNNHLNKRKRQVVAFSKKVWEILKRPEMAVLPGQLAFFLILSFSRFMISSVILSLSKWK